MAGLSGKPRQMAAYIMSLDTKEERREALDERVRGDVRCAEAAHFFRWLDETAKRNILGGICASIN